MDADWVDLKTDVDNVTNLSDNPFVSKICAVTRSQNSKLIDSKWLSGYTTKELENFQREDSDLGPIPKWQDNNCKANRDEIASYSPSTRKYWLNYDLLITKNNVLYQKRLQPTGESYQLLVPKVLRKEVMTSCHNTMYSAHFGVNKTKDKIKTCYQCALSENSKELSLSNVSNENISGNVVLNPSCSFNSVCSSICSDDVKNQSHYSVSNKNHTCNSNLALHSSYSFNSESSCSVNLKNSKDVISSIKVLSLNVCGILAKLKAPELEELCSNYDIVCFCKTKLDELDVVELDHFRLLPPLNRKNGKCKSGGIAVFVKNSIFVNIELLHSSCENVLWFVVNQLFDVPVLFGTVYIPPVNSIYSSIDIFDVIEDDLITFITEKDYTVCLIGDFNAHTGTKPDYIVLDEYICNSMQLDNIPSHDININNLDKFGININRASLDKSVDNYGNRLLQLCKSLELFIANGRLGKDSGIGALTCKEATVVDYCILSPELFTHVCEFKILPFDAMISDVHNGVHIEFLSTNKPNVGIQYQSFVDNLNDTEIDNICEKLNVLEVENIDKSVINNLVEDCNIIIRDAADASGLFNIICNNSVSGSRRKNKPNKPWFNRECFVKRKEYHRAKNYNWRVKTVESKNSMVRCSKAYKKSS
ncbi:unnamed protein product [Mytilus coruscus]|uniref:Integrase zinc-binding domain-containing protein n=1 Tax=Mytilus coruscus TaxID=42192 RepID=A0A6J8CEU0_MYTCO|nr:unnamed protein product [Mytilus coruscus]